MTLAAIPVSSLMTRDAIAVQKGQSLALARQMMIERGIRHLPVVHDGWVDGVLSMRDVEAAASRLDEPVGHAMTRCAVTVTAAQSALAAVRLLVRHQIHCLPVVDEWGWLIGIVTSTDLIRLATKILPRHSAVAVAVVLTRRPRRAVAADAAIEGDAAPQVEATAELAAAAAVMLAHHLDSVRVMDRGVEAGRLTVEDVLEHLVEAAAEPVVRGAAEIPVSYYMTSPVRTVGYDEALLVATAILRAHQISSVVVVDGARTIGVLARSDLVPCELGDETMPVSARMTRRVLEVGPSTSVAEACRILIEHEVHQLVVSEGAEALGVLSRSDLMAAARDLRLADPVSRWATPTAFVAEVDRPVREILELLDRADLGSVLLMDGIRPVGVFGRRERIAVGASDLDRPIEAFMSSRIIVLADDLPLHRAAAQMSATGVELAVVVVDDVHHTVLTPSDVVRALVAHGSADGGRGRRRPAGWLRR